MTTKTVMVLAAILWMLLAGGCATSPVGSRDYPVHTARTPGTLEAGVVVAVRNVTIRDRTHRGAVGATVGGLAGGILGSQVGQGSGRRVAQVAGTGAGALVGARVDQSLATQPGYEIVVRRDDGRHVVVTQGADVSFRPGQPVRLIRHGGIYRVAP